MIINDFFSSILFASSFLILGIAFFSRKNSKSYIFYCLLTVAIYSIGYGFEIMYASIPWIEFWLKIEYIGIAFLPTAWVCFVLEYTGQKRVLTKKLFVGMASISLFIITCVYTNSYHHLFYYKIYIDKTSLFPMAGLVKGPLYWINDIYAYISMAIGFVWLFQFYRKSIHSVRRQIRFIVVAWTIPWIADMVYTLRLLPFHGDLCPFAFSVSGIISSIAIIYGDFIRLTPIGMEQVFSHISDGALILDQTGNIVNYNPFAQQILAFLQKKCEAKVQNDIWLQRALKENEAESGLLKLNDGKEKERYYKIKISQIQHKEKIIGKIILFSDVTRLELERQTKEKDYHFLQTLMDTLKNPIYSKDITGQYLQCNLAFCDYFGLDKDEIIGKTDYAFLDVNVAREHEKIDEKLRKTGENQTIETKLKHRDGTWHDVYVNQSLLYENDEKLYTRGSVGVIIDVSEQKKNQKKMDKLITLKESMLKIGYEINEIMKLEDLLHLILREVILCMEEACCGSILVLGEDNRLRIAAQKGFVENEAKHFSVSLEEHLQNINRGEATHKTVVCDDSLNINMLSTVEGITLKAVISTPIILEGSLYGFLIMNSRQSNVYDAFDIEIMEYMRNQLASVISKHKLFEKTLYLSRYDHLTNIFNRNYFESVFEQLIRSKHEKTFYFVLFDLNDLKQVNDIYGHLAGDAIITCFADGLQSKLEEEDFLGRYGGDEFVGVFFHKTKEILENEFQNLRRIFQNQPISFEKGTITCDFSYGFAQYPQEGNTFKELVKIADERMYDSKKIKKQGGKQNVSLMG